MTYRYLTPEQVIGLYIKITKTWNQPVQPILHRYALESACAKPQNLAHYEQAGLERQAASLLEGLVKAHAFMDGNKRVAFLATFVFLELNGFSLPVLSQDEMADFVLSITQNQPSLDDIEKWLSERVIPLAP